MQEGRHQFPELVVWEGVTPYPDAMTRMENRLAAVIAGTAPEALIFCEHEPVLTIGSSGKDSDIGPLVDIPVIPTGRGGQVTYHGPGQRVVYLVVGLDRWNRDIRAYVRWLQDWLIGALGTLGVTAFTTDDVGVWVETPTGIAKIAALGVRVRKGVAYHGIALNICNDLSIYGKFTPCGITDKGVTSLRALGVGTGLGDDDLMVLVDSALCRACVERWPCPPVDPTDTHAAGNPILPAENTCQGPTFSLAYKP